MTIPISSILFRLVIPSIRQRRSRGPGFLCAEAVAQLVASWLRLGQLVSGHYELCASLRYHDGGGGRVAWIGEG